MKPKAFIKAVGANAKTFVVENTPEIEITLGFGGMLAAVGFAIDAAPKAQALADEKKKELKKSELKPKEYVEATWRVWVPTVGSIIVSGALVAIGLRTNCKHKAATATAYALTEEAFRTYQEKVVETIGEKKERAIQDEIAKDELRKNPPHISEIPSNAPGECVIIEPITHSAIVSSVQKVGLALNEYNARINTSMDSVQPYNEFLYNLGIRARPECDEIGNNTSHLLDIFFTADTYDHDGVTVPALVINFRPGARPLREYLRG